MSRVMIGRSIAIMVTGAMLISMVLFLQGCPGIVGGKEVKPFTEMTPKEKSVFLMTTYSKQYDDYVELWEKPNRTAAQQEILERKYEWIQEVYPYIDTYSSYAEGGIIPPAEIEKIVLDLVNKSLGL